MSRRYLITIFAIILTIATQVVSAVEYKSCADNLQKFNHCSSSLLWGPTSARCRRALIWDYGINLFGPLNRHLRGIHPDPSCEAVIPILETAVKRIPPELVLLFRGTRKFRALENINIGECYADLGFQSVTPNRDTAQRFAGENGMLLEIQANNARNISKYVNYREEEFLLLPNTFLKLTGKITHETGVVLKFREVDEQSCVIINH